MGSLVSTRAQAAVQASPTVGTDPENVVSYFNTLQLPRSQEFDLGAPLQLFALVCDAC